MPRFAILTHDHPTLHWDFLLEDGATCRTWRLAECPVYGVKISAVRIPNHRLVYLDYDGPIRGNRGSVSCWDRGVFEWVTDDLSLLEIDLRGSRIDGVCSLEFVAEEQWTAIFLERC